MTQKYTTYFLSEGRHDEVAGESERRLWYEAPNRMRVESPGGASVWDGQEHWTYNAEQNFVRLLRQDPNSDTFSQVQPGNFDNPVDDLDTFLEQTAGCRRARLTGEGEIAGRSAHIVKLGRTHCGVVFPGADGRLVLWIDQETGLVLKTEQYSVDDHLYTVMEVVSVEYNVSIDPARFRFAMPPSAELYDDRDQPLGVGTRVQLPKPEFTTVDKVQETATFPIQIPSVIPAGFELESVEHNWWSEEAKELRSHADWVLLRYLDSQGNWLLISQGFGSGFVTASATPPDGYTGTIDINGAQARWVNGYGSTEAWEPGIRSSLFWEAGKIGDGYEISPDGEVRTGSPISIGLTSNVLTVDDLKAIAESME